MVPLICAVAMVGRQSWETDLGRENWLGKTDAQVLAMGRLGWETYSREHHGWWKVVDYVYAGSAEKRNLELLRRPGEAHTREKRELHGLIGRLITESCRLGYLHDSFNGWGTIGGRLAAMGEDAYYAHLRPNRKPRASAMVVSYVTKAIDKTFSDIGDDPESNSANAKSDLRKFKAELRVTFRQIVSLVAKTTDRRGSDQILSFCRFCVRAIEDEGKDMDL